MKILWRCCRGIAALILLVVWPLDGYGQVEGSADQYLRPGDVLRITVWPDASLGGEFVIESGGDVFLPFLGRTNTTGVSMSDLTAQLREGYQTGQRNAVVTVTPLFRVGIMGGVNRPGLYFVPQTDNFFDVINQAGGFTIRAKADNVTLVREGLVVPLNATESLSTGDLLPLEALGLQSGDQIVVPVGGEPMGFRDWVALANLAISMILLVDRLQN